MKKIFSALGKSLLILLTAVIGLLIISVTVNGLMTFVERGTLKTLGVSVEVHGSRIHTYTSGNGATNVVLLSGLGTSVPILDFLPLVRQLETRFRVTVVEYPGYGLSDDTDSPRSTEASVEEVRAALSAISVRPPYLLVVHSVSGLQALLYSNKYPQEVAGVLGLDISVPGQETSMKWETAAVNVYEILRVLGIVRLALAVAPGLGGAEGVGLSPEQVKDYNTMTNWTVGSHAIFHEANAFPTNLRSLAGLKFPGSLPVTLVLASDSVGQTAPGIPGAVWTRLHEGIIVPGANSKVVVLPGNHYVHHGNERRIAELVEELSEASATR